MQNRYARFAVVVLLIAVYLALRISRIDETCLWFDEIFSVHAASQPWGSILSFVALDLIHPPLFYLILKAWIAVGGDGVMWLRGLPIVFSVLAILPLLLFLRELRQNFNVKLLSLCLLIVDGSILKYSLEVRMYSLMLCLSLFSMWLFVRYAERRASIVPLVAVNILLVYTHYFGWFVIASEVAAALLFYRQSWKKMAGLSAAVFATFLPWAVAVLNASAGGSGLAQNIGWMTRPGPRDVFIFVLNLIEPFYYRMGSSEPVSNLLITTPILALLAIIVCVAVSNWSVFQEQTRKALLLLGTFFLIPLVLAFISSWISPYSIWGTRHLIIVFVPFIAIIVIAAAEIPERPIRLSVLGSGILVCLGAAGMNAFREPQKFAWCEAGPLTATVDAEVPIYATEDLIAYHLWFDHRNGRPNRRIVKLDNTSGLGEDAAYFLPRGFSDVTRTEIDAVNEPRLWLVQRGRELREAEPPLRNFLLKGYKITDRKTETVTGEEVGAFLLEK